MWDSYREAVVAGQGCVSTIGPGQLSGEPGEGVVDGPGNDEVVIDDHKEADHQHAIPQTLGCRSHSAKDLQWTLGSVLT